MTLEYNTEYKEACKVCGKVPSKIHSIDMANASYNYFCRDCLVHMDVYLKRLEVL